VLQLTISFTTGIDSTYDEYVFKFINIHPSVNDRFYISMVLQMVAVLMDVTLTSTNFQSSSF
jgi:hypothetical protein